MPHHLSSQSRRFDVAALASALDRALADGEISLREAARSLGLAPSTLTRIRQGGRPDAEATLVLMDWLGLSPAELLAETEPRAGARQRAPRPERSTPRRPRATT